MDLLARATALTKSLADESRLRIVRVLLHGAFQVGELVDVLDMGQSRVSRHLRILTDAGLLEAHREGTRVFYRMRHEPLTTALVRWLAETLPGAPHPQDDARLAAVWEARRDRSRDAFRRAAVDWSDAQAAYLGSPDTRPHLLALLGGGTLAVDVGVGTGALLPDLARRFQRVVGVDASAPMLERARETVRGGDLGNVELRIGEIERLPLEDGTADAVVANMVLHHASEPGLAVRECFRSIRAGGRLLVGDFESHDNEWMREELGDQWLGFDPEAVSAWLRQAGFQDIEIRRVTNETSPLRVFVASATKERTGTAVPGDHPEAASAARSV